MDPLWQNFLEWSATYIEVNFRLDFIMEANTMSIDQTAPKNMSLQESRPQMSWLAGKGLFHRFWHHALMLENLFPNCLGKCFPTFKSTVASAADNYKYKVLSLYFKGLQGRGKCKLWDRSVKYIAQISFVTRRSRKFCQNFDNFCLWGREDPNANISGPSSGRQWNAI